MCIFFRNSLKCHLTYAYGRNVTWRSIFSSVRRWVAQHDTERGPRPPLWVSWLWYLALHDAAWLTLKSSSQALSVMTSTILAPLVTVTTKRNSTRWTAIIGDLLRAVLVRCPDVQLQEKLRILNKQLRLSEDMLIGWCLNK